MTENNQGQNALLLELMRPEKRPRLKTAEMLLRTALGSKKAHGPGAIAAETGQSYDEILRETVERLRSCRAVIVADPATYKEDAIDIIDKMIASAVSAADDRGKFGVRIR